MGVEITRQIIAFLLAVELILNLSGYTASVSALNEQSLGQSGNVVIAKGGATKSAVLPAGLRTTKHFLERMAERGVTAEQVVDVLRTGKRFFDPKYGETVWWKDGVYIPIANDGALKTVVRGPISRRWRPL